MFTIFFSKKVRLITLFHECRPILIVIKRRIIAKRAISIKMLRQKSGDCSREMVTKANSVRSVLVDLCE